MSYVKNGGALLVPAQATVATHEQYLVRFCYFMWFIMCLHSSSGVMGMAMQLSALQQRQHRVFLPLSFVLNLMCCLCE